MFVVIFQSVHVYMGSIATVRLLVALQIHPALEAELTARTVEGPVAAVFSAVGDEVGALAESFTTHLTHVWFLTYKRGPGRSA